MRSSHQIYPTVLVINCGSSSLKCGLFYGEHEVISSRIEGIGATASNYTVKAGGTQKNSQVNAPTLSVALNIVLSDIERKTRGETISFVAHRVVHGGERLTHHTEITNEIEEEIQKLSLIAPLHNPANLQGVHAAKKHFPHARHIACFDTAFHHTIPQFAFLYGIPLNLYKKYGIRKYGFHGLSHEYCARKVYESTARSDKIISCHLGAGSSICAIHRARSSDTTMGFSPLDGLLMATRAGELDPDIPLFIMEQEKISAKEMLEMLNKESGLKGLTGTADLREVKKKADEGDAMSKTAIEMLAYRIATTIGSYYVALGGAKTITFTGGVGENAYWLREKVCLQLRSLGVALDARANTEGKQVISAPESEITVMVIPANEELHMARIVLEGRYIEKDRIT